MTNEDILQIALQQSAIDCNCRPEDFLSYHCVLTHSKANPKARKYIPLPLECDLVSYGNNVVAQTSPCLAETVREFLTAYPPEHCFETPNLHVLDEALRPYGLKICFMAEYFLPDIRELKEQSCQYNLKILQKDHFSNLYCEQWSNALCEARKESDILAVGAYDGNMLVGLAGCSADCDTMYQIGVDVLPAYRKKGIAAAVTSRLALEILAIGKVPFYCAAWSNIKSVRNAIRCGFRPAWVEMTARDINFVDKINQKN